MKPRVAPTSCRISTSSRREYMASRMTLDVVNVAATSSTTPKNVPAPPATLTSESRRFTQPVS